MPIKNKVKLENGTLCKVLVNNNPDVNCGDIIEFVHYHSIEGYIFKDKKGIKVIFKDDIEFQILPLENDLRDIIDIALATGDKEWFNELTLRLKTETIKD